MANIYSMVDTWNDGATTFTSIKMNVTDTASGASSLLLDLQVGGVSKASVNKNGQAYFAGLGDFNPDIRLGTPSSVGVGQYTNNSFFIDISGEKPLFIYRSGTDKRVQLAKDYFFGWQPVSGGATSAAATRLYQDADYTLAQRNGVNAQTFNLYNTYTDASNYERGFMKWNSNVLEIGAEAAGTGSARSVVIKQGGQNRVTVGATITIANGVSNVFIDSTTYFASTTAANSRAAAGNGFKVGSAYTYDFSSTTGANGAADAGIKRTAAAQLQITDGSTGTGQLIFIVPTTDPAITGALWNNAGTLSISA